MPQLDPSTFLTQIVWLAITFTLLYFIMARIALPRLGAVLEQRRDRIASDIDEAERLRDDSVKVNEEYEAALAEGRARAHAIAQEVRNTLRQELDKEREDVEKELAERIETAESDIARARDAALAKIDAVAAESAAAIVQRLIGKRIDDKVAVEAVERAARS